MSKIIIDFNIFDMMGDLYITDDQGNIEEMKQYSGVDNITAAAVEFAHKLNSNYVGISTTPIYGEMIKEIITNTFTKEYGNNNIIIEVL